MSPHGGGLIGGPKEPPVLSPMLTKTSVCGCVEDGGGREDSRREELVSHRILGGDELEGGLAIRLQGDMTHSFSHTSTYIYTHTLSGGFWCQLLASSSTNDPRLTHIVSHV